jgi:two-component system, OmpR family, sensor kinase
MLSFQRRLVLAHLAATLTVVGAAAWAGWWELSRSVHEQLDAALLALAETEAGMLADGKGQAIHVHEAPAGTAPPSLVRLDRLVQIIDGKGQVLARSANLGVARLPAPPSLLAELAAGQTVFETLPHVSEEPLRMVSVPAITKGRVLAVQVAGSLDDADHVLKSAALLFAGMAAALLVAVALTGAALTRRVFHAVEEVNGQARRIGEANLDARLPSPGTDDEFGHLVATLNAMLDRLERAFDMQRRFTADASHELRSPLSRLRTEIEITLRRPRDTQAYVDTLRSCMDEVERMTLLVDELLMLARLDAGQEPVRAEALALDTLARHVVDRMRASAAERRIAIALDAPVPIEAAVAPRAAELVLTNLLGNAIKFSPRDTTITLRLTSEEREAVLCVADQGPGIDRGDLPRLFDRFYRGAAARAGDAEGAGLGLALVQAIVHAYRGRLDADNGPAGGAVFTVRLPLAALPQA